MAYLSTWIRFGFNFRKECHNYQLSSNVYIFQKKVELSTSLLTVTLITCFLSAVFTKRGALGLGSTLTKFISAKLRHLQDSMNQASPFYYLPTNKGKYVLR